jgi:hypothetical protein
MVAAKTPVPPEPEEMTYEKILEVYPVNDWPWPNQDEAINKYGCDYEVWCGVAKDPDGCHTVRFIEPSNGHMMVLIMVEVPDMREGGTIPRWVMAEVLPEWVNQVRGITAPGGVEEMWELKNKKEVTPA